MSIKDKEVLQNVAVLVGVFFGAYLLGLGYEHRLASMFGAGIISGFAVLGILFVRRRRRVQTVSSTALRLTTILWMIFSLIIPLQIIHRTNFEMSLMLAMPMKLLLMVGLVGTILMMVQLFRSSNGSTHQELSDLQVLATVLIPLALLFASPILVMPIFESLQVSYAELNFMPFAIYAVTGIGLSILSAILLIDLRGVYKLCCLPSFVVGIFSVIIALYGLAN